MDQYQTSNAPTFHGWACHPYQPFVPNMVGYCLRPLVTMALLFTTSIMVRHASMYFGSPVTHRALLKPTMARGIRLRSSRRPVTGFTGLKPHPYALPHHFPVLPPILPSRSTKLGTMPLFRFIRSSQASM